MMNEKGHITNKGGRPKKAVKRNYALTVKCSAIEKSVIERKAKDSGNTVAEYLRQMGLSGKIDRQLKVIPKEILEYKATLNHMAANLNQAAKKANSNEPITALERQGLFDLERTIKGHIKNVEKYFQ